MKKKIDWTDIWHFPLWYDDCDYAWSKDEKEGLIMALTFEEDYGLDENGNPYCTGRNKHLMDIINGVCPNDTDKNWSVKDGCDIYDGDEYIFCARGWGHLTGVLKLSSKEACEVQDGFINYILSILNND